MTHVIFDPDSVNWASFLESQAGGSRFFVGSRYQRGYGFGSSVLRSVSRLLVPIAKNIAASAGQEGLTAGANLIKDLSEGKNLKESLTQHSKQGVENLAKRLEQCGKGKRKKKRTKLEIISTPMPTIKNKRRIIDQLTF